MESKGGASYCASAGTSHRDTETQRRRRISVPLCLRLPDEALAESGGTSCPRVLLIGAPSGRRELEHLVIRRIERVAAASGEHGVSTDHEQLAVERRDVDAMPAGR